MSEPLYIGIARQIRDAISAGTYPPGSALPSEVELAKSYGVSRDTIRDALATLRSEGLITSQRGYLARVIGQRTRLVVPIPPGAVITARMPLLEERTAAGRGDRIVPLLVVTIEGEPERIYWADVTELCQSP